MYYWIINKPQKDFIKIEEEEYDSELFDDLESISFEKNKINVEVTYKGNKSTIKQDLLKDHTIFIVSEKFRNILIKNNEDVPFLEFYPISLKEIKSKSVDKKSYYVVNILNDIDCFDLEKYKFEYDSGGVSINKISKLVLKKEMVGSRNIFRLSEENRLYVFISEKLRKIIEKEKLIGYELIPENKFYQPYLGQ